MGKSQLDTTNESQEVSPFQAGDHKAHIDRRTQRLCKHKTEDPHMIIGHLVILNSVQEIKDIQGQEWKEIVHTILRIGIIRAFNESAGRLFRAAFFVTY